MPISQKAVVFLAAAAITAVGCGGSATQSVHGTVLGGTQAAATVIGAFGGGKGLCAGAVAGTQVIVKGPSGTLLATTTLRKDTSASRALKLPASLTGQAGRAGVYEFSTSIPAGNGPYTTATTVCLRQITRWVGAMVHGSPEANRAEQEGLPVEHTQPTDEVELPAPRLIRSPRDAEAAAADWCRWLGFADAGLTQAGSDGR